MIALDALGWTWAAVAAAAAALLVALAAGAALGRRRADVWRSFAARHGLAHAREGRTRRVTGEVEGRRVRLETVARGSGGEGAGVRVVALAAALADPPPAGTTVLEARGLPGVLHRELEDRPARTGDARFDERAVVATDAPEAVRAWLGRERRAALLELFERAGAAVSGVRGGEVFVESRELVAGEEQLERRLRSVLAAASALDAPAAVPGGDAPMRRP